jgi:hypothetical protein
MTSSELEIVWPLHKWHYLSPGLIDMSADIPMDDTSESIPATGRVVAARALLPGPTTRRSGSPRCSTRAGAASAERRARMSWRRCRTRLLVAQACALLAESASNGSTADEREAADAWLTRVLQDERQVEQGSDDAVVKRRPS